jgi:putative endonuclease
VSSTRARADLGKAGENRAVRELERRGYAICARRYRTRFGEIDIIAKDGDVLVFVEVKARSSKACGAAADAVPAWKQRRLAAMALRYLGRSGRLDVPCRFDVVAIDGLGGPHESVALVRDAFSVPSSAGR